jgi:hypothetical protein
MIRLIVASVAFLTLATSSAGATPYVRDNMFSIEPPAGWPRHPEHAAIVREAERNGLPAPLVSWQAPDGCGRLLITALPTPITNLERGLRDLARGMTTTQPSTVALRNEIERHGNQPMMVVEARRTVTDPVRQLSVVLPHRARPMMASYAVLERCWPSLRSGIGASYRSFRELNPQNTEKTYRRKTFWEDYGVLTIGLAALFVVVLAVEWRRRRG